VRGEIYRLRAPRDSPGHEQAGSRYAVVAGRLTRVLAEQTAAIDPSRIGGSAGHLTFDELRRVDAALRLALDL
jgi:mRNA interferase MazF